MTTGKIETTRWDVIENLASLEQVAAYIDAALEDDDAEMLVVAVDDILRARTQYAVCRSASI